MKERPHNVVNLADVPASEWGEGRCRMRRRDLGRAAGSVDVGVKHITLPAGYRSYPAHYHTAEEELVYVLRGRGTLIQDGHSVPVGEGDVISHPAATGVSHTLVADRGEDLEYLAFGERDPQDVIFYPDSGKVLIRALPGDSPLGLVGRVVETEYWDGER